MKLAEPSPVTGVGVVLHVPRYSDPYFSMIAKSLSLRSSARWLGFPSFMYRVTFSFQFLDGNPERDPAFSVLPGSEVAVRSDPISEEACLFRGGMRDQGLFRGQFEFEMIAQECPESSLDFLGLIPWASEAEQEVIGVSDVGRRR